MDAECFFHAIRRLKPGDTLRSFLKDYRDMTDAVERAGGTKTKRTVLKQGFPEWKIAPEQCLELCPPRFLDEALNGPKKPLWKCPVVPEPSLEEFLVSIGSPSFERETGSQKKNTFDFIRLWVSITTQGRTKKQQKAAAEKYRDTLTEKALEAVTNDPRFEAYGVPTSFLKLDNITLTHDSRMEFLFGLKEKPTGHKEKGK